MLLSYYNDDNHDGTKIDDESDKHKITNFFLWPKSPTQFQDA